MVDTAVWVVILHFTVMGYGGDALPEGPRYRVAFGTEVECQKVIPAVRRSFRQSGMPLTPDKITCERLEIRQP